MANAFDTMGVMIDMSRNAIMSVDGLKKFIPLLAKMGYNALMLYTEDTYEIEDEPFFGYMRGRYSKAELKEIDDFAFAHGMEVIPCIQTLAHLNAFVRWNTAPVDYGNILLADDERTYDLIAKMLKTTAECFRSRKIHVGMDEAYMLGRGKHLDIHGYEKIDSIMERHLKRVLELGKPYGYEMMIWSDMYFRQWNGGKYFAPKTVLPRETVDAFPKEVIPVYWDYYKTDEEAYSGMIENHKQLSDKTWFAGGAWCWYGMTPFNKFTLQAMQPAYDACRKHGIRNMFLTMWGDDGGECSVYAVLPSLYYLAQYANGITDEEKIKSGFYRLTGVSFDDFMKLDLPNDVVTPGQRPKNPAKYMLYTDYFNGFLDYTVRPGGGAQYGTFAQELSAIAKKTRTYGWLFDAAAKHCRLLEYKYELGIQTRKAYEAGDREALRRLAEKEYPEVIRRFKVYAKAFEKQWLMTNKPQGFDVQHHRLGGMILRTEACRRRILDYVSGKLPKIEELEEPLLPYGEKENGGNYNKAQYYSTPNLVYHWNQ